MDVTLICTLSSARGNGNIYLLEILSLSFVEYTYHFYHHPFSEFSTFSTFSRFSTGLSNSLARSDVMGGRLVLLTRIFPLWLLGTTTVLHTARYLTFHSFLPPPLLSSSFSSSSSSSSFFSSYFTLTSNNILTVNVMVIVFLML